MKNIEIERKFLVRDDSFKRLAVARYEIIQGYISKDVERTVRVRIKRELPMGIGSSKEEEVRAYLTIKSKPNTLGFSRFEWERAIGIDDAHQLLQLCLPNPIKKSRWIVPCLGTEDSMSGRGLRWEIDEFHGHLSGLVLAELELNSEQQSFERPAFIGEEVTGDPRYYNANM